MKLHLPLSLRSALVACFATLVSTPAWSADIVDGQEWNPADNCWVHNDITSLNTASGTPANGQLTMKPAGSEVNNDQRNATVKDIILTDGVTLTATYNQWAGESWNFTNLQVEQLSLAEGASSATFAVGSGAVATLGTVGGSDFVDSDITVWVEGTLNLDINQIDELYSQITDKNGTLNLTGTLDATRYTTAQTVNLLGDTNTFAFNNLNLEHTAVTVGSGMRGSLSYENQQLLLTVSEAGGIMRVETAGGSMATTSHTSTTFIGQAIAPFEGATIDATQSWSLHLTGTLTGYNPGMSNVIVSTFDPGHTDNFTYANPDFSLTIGQDGKLQLRARQGGVMTLYAGSGDETTMWSNATYDITISYSSVNYVLYYGAGSITIDGVTHEITAAKTGEGEYIFCIPEAGSLDQLYTRTAGQSTIDLGLSGPAVTASVGYQWNLPEDTTIQKLVGAQHEAQDGSNVAMVPTDTIHFMGGTLGTDSDAILSNPISVENGCAVKLAAAADTTLTIVQGEAALNSTGAGLEVSGGGTIALQGITTSNLANLSIGENTRLELDGSIRTITLDTANNISIDPTASLARTDDYALDIKGNLQVAALEAGQINLLENSTVTAGTLKTDAATLKTGGTLTAGQLDAGSLELATGSSATADGITTTNGIINADATLQVLKSGVNAKFLYNGGTATIAGGLDVSGTMLGNGTTTVGDATITNSELEGLSIREGSLSATSLKGGKVSMGDIAISDSTLKGLSINGRNITATSMAGGSISSGNQPTRAAAPSTYSLGQVTGASISCASGHMTVIDTQLDAASSITASADGLTLTRVSLAAGNSVTIGSGSFSTATDITLSGEAAENTLTLNQVALDLSGQGIPSTGTLTLISGMDVNLLSDADISLTLDPATYGQLMVDTATGDLVLALHRDDSIVIDELSHTPNSSATIRALTHDAATAGGIMQDLLHYVQDSAHHSLAQRKAALAAISGSSLTILADSQRRGIGNTLSSIRNRVIQMGGSPEHESGPQYHAWIQAEGGYNNISSDGDAAGYSYSTYGGTVGAHLNTGRASFGLALTSTYGSLNASCDDQAEGDNDATYISAFARYQSGNWIHMGILTAGFNDMELTRQVVGYEAHGESKGSSVSAYYETGYALALGEDGDQVLQPLASLTLSSASLDSHSEGGSIGNAGLIRNGEDYFYGSIGIGARYQAILSRDVNERRSFLELRAKLVQDFGDDCNEATVRFAGGRTPFTVCGSEVGSFGAQIGAGLSLPVGMQTTMFMDVDADFRDKATSVSGSVGFRYEF